MRRGWRDHVSPFVRSVCDLTYLFKAVLFFIKCKQELFAPICLSMAELLIDRLSVRNAQKSSAIMVSFFSNKISPLWSKFINNWILLFIVEIDAKKNKLPKGTIAYIASSWRSRWCRSLKASVANTASSPVLLTIWICAWIFIVHTSGNTHWIGAGVLNKPSTPWRCSAVERRGIWGFIGNDRNVSVKKKEKIFADGRGEQQSKGPPWTKQ